jgi:hypothetical protein
MAKAEKTTKSKPAIYHNYISGEWKPSRSGEYFENTNPAETKKT